MPKSKKKRHCINIAQQHRKRANINRINKSLESMDIDQLSEIQDALKQDIHANLSIYHDIKEKKLITLIYNMSTKERQDIIKLIEKMRYNKVQMKKNLVTIFTIKSSRIFYLSI